MSRHHHFEEERKPDTREAGQEHMDGEQNVPSEGCVPDGEELERLCREQICPTCDTGREAEETRLRALAEMDNFKKRLQRERDEQVRYAAENVLADLLPTLDNLDLALQYGSRVEACKDMLTGVEMTRKLLLDALKNHGLEVVGREGDPFNPEHHEAMGQEESAEMDNGHILRVMQKGYKLRERLLRPAKVIVSKAAKPHLSVKI
ncbi:MAG TPA: nucleotide exchange factor GrpE [Candidatus Mailhella excrementigallinarum]|nr:MAG: nucleotide exchange factor GrpE [Desulfovibrionaceae bacterium]HIV64890.1 nucleotide exchange factor GrpE [Candidatus Mailhella excrementigallinarum]